MQLIEGSYVVLKCCSQWPSPFSPWPYFIQFLCMWFRFSLEETKFEVQDEVEHQMHPIDKGNTGVWTNPWALGHLLNTSMVWIFVPGPELKCNPVEKALKHNTVQMQMWLAMVSAEDPVAPVWRAAMRPFPRACSSFPSPPMERCWDQPQTLSAPQST